jgi:RNA polymerase sigma-70 factor, ECF subfamily
VIPAPRQGADEAATEVALAAQAGDPEAATALVRLTQGEVWRFVATLVDQDVADDLTQETYLRAFRSLPGFAARASARTWLLGIARHVCADHIRTLQRRRRLAGRLPAPETEPDHAGLLGAADLIHRLNDERRGAFVLTQVVGLSYAQVAEIEGVPVGTIRSRVARARDQLMAAVEAARAG